MYTDKQSVELIQYCGFNCVTLANNHIFDYGDEGLNDLLECISSLGVDYVGAGHNIDIAKSTLYKRIKTETVAFINCCEHEFSIASEEHGGANPLNPVAQYYAIKEAKIKAKYVIVIVHAGSINCQLPSPRLQELFRFFIDCGASAVVCHHQHCFSGYEYYKGAPIVYGLGNLLFDKPWLANTMWTDGYLLALNVRSDGTINIEIIPYTQCAEEPRVVLKKGDQLNKILTEIDKLNRIIESPTLLKESYFRWVDNNDTQCSNALSAVKNRFIRALMNRGILPSLRADSIQMLNYIYCESHLERMVRYLKLKNHII